MRRIVFLILCVAAGGLACGDEAEDPAASWKRCESPGVIVRSEQLVTFGAQECEDLSEEGVISISGAMFESVEALRGLKRVGVIQLSGTGVSSLEPLTTLEVVGERLTFRNSPLIPFCEITGLAADLRRKGNTFEVDINGMTPEQHPDAAQACDTFPR